MDRGGGTGGEEEDTLAGPCSTLNLLTYFPIAPTCSVTEQRHSLWIFSILSKMAVVVVEKKLDRGHVGKIVKPGNHDSINLSYSLSKKIENNDNLRDAFAPIKLVDQHNCCASRFDDKKQPSSPLVTRLACVASTSCRLLTLSPSLLTMSKKSASFSQRPPSFPPSRESGIWHCLAVLDGGVGQPHTNPCWVFSV